MKPDEIYVKQMDTWIKESEARREQIVNSRSVNNISR